MKNIILGIVIGAVAVTGVAFAQTYVDKDDTVDETVRVVEKTQTIEVVEDIDAAHELEAMRADKADIESIVVRFNGHRVRYNEVMTVIGSAETPMPELKVTFPTIREVVEEVK